MKLSYYPGCSLEGTASDYAASIAGVAELLGLTLAELPDWNCCGASAAHSLDEQAARALPLRNLRLAQTIGLDVVAPCALCFNRLKAGAKDLASRGEAVTLRVWDLLDLLTQPAFLRLIAHRLVRPLIGLQAVCYYGCLVNRPPAITDAASPENPGNMEKLLAVLGATPLDWSFKTDCCGAGLAVARPDLIDRLVRRLYDRALRAGAECIVVSCQMCQANLDLPQARISRQAGRAYNLPILYFTELIALALGHPEVPQWLARHLVDPRPLLTAKGLL
jgi:heterodisulfide reductase subunit B